MNRSRQTPWWLVFCIAGQGIFFHTLAGTVPGVPPPVKLFSASTNDLSALPRPRSPVDLFRQLLAMTPEERDAYLTHRPAQTRERILAKIDEYEALDPDERELRLRATELRWYLLPLLQVPPDKRTARLAQVPPGMRELVQSRLSQWSLLPPSLQQEFLENERALRYFSSVDLSNGPPLPQTASADPEAARWSAMPADERNKIAASVNQFFELTPDEKSAALNTLSDAERRQMHNTLLAFDNLPPNQRDECIQAYAKFTGMSPLEKKAFLKNAEHWSQMSPAERRTWRDLVANVPEWPPLPQGFMASPPSPRNLQPGAATNPN
jgi:predicted Fe-S protein YdhL (DUF1289 family)